jgi:hypothetical protein
MALQVNGNFELENGLTLTKVYARTNAALSLRGDEVMAYPEFWVDEPAFSAGKDNLRIRIRENFSYKYDRAVDGVDILTFANQKVKETLEGLGYTVTIVEI